MQGFKTWHGGAEVMSHSDIGERNIKLKYALLIIVVLAIVLIPIGVTIGNKFFWKTEETVTKSEFDFQRIHNVVINNPNNAEAHVALGFQFLARGQRNEGLREFETAYKLDPQSQAARFGLGFGYREVGQYQKAVDILEPLVKEFPFHFLGQCNLGLAYQKLKEYDKAVKSYQMALKIKPGSADVYLELARIYIDTGKKDEALKNIEIALKYVPGYQDAINLKKSLDTK